MTQSVLITGGAGFIGSHLTEALLERGERVVVLDDLSTGDASNLRGVIDHPRFELVVGSVLDDLKVDELVHRCDVIVHLAAAVGVKLIVEQPLQLVHHEHSRFGDRGRCGSSLPPQDPRREHLGDLRQERHGAPGRVGRPRPRHDVGRAVVVQHGEGRGRDPRARPITASAACSPSLRACSTPWVRASLPRTGWSSRVSFARRSPASHSRSTATAARAGASATSPTSSARSSACSTATTRAARCSTSGRRRR